MSVHALIAYDGSDESRRAIRAAARLLEGAAVCVLYVGEPPHATVIGPAPGPMVPEPPPAVHADVLAAAERAAHEVAEEGVREASAAGLRAAPLTALALGPADVAAAIIRAADEHEAAVIVVGSPPRSAIKRALLGSVASSVVDHSHRPVLVVPPHESA